MLLFSLAQNVKRSSRRERNLLTILRIQNVVVSCQSHFTHTNTHTNDGYYYWTVCLHASIFSVFPFFKRNRTKLCFGGCFGVCVCARGENEKRATTTTITRFLSRISIESSSADVGKLYIANTNATGTIR